MWDGMAPFKEGSSSGARGIESTTNWYGMTESFVLSAGFVRGVM